VYYTRTISIEDDVCFCELEF